MKEKLLEIVNLTHRYHYEPYTLFENLCFEIAKGQKYGIFIDKLEGKTTLAKLICGIIKPQKGEVLFEGEKVLNCDNGIAVLWNDFALIPNRSVRFNLKFVLKIRKVKQYNLLIEQTMDKWGLRELEKAKVKKLDKKTKLNIALARLSLRRIRLLVVDGVYENLSFEETKILNDFLSAIETVVILSKELSALQNCDTVMVVKDKCVALLGTFKQAQEFVKRQQ